MVCVACIVGLHTQRNFYSKTFYFERQNARFPVLMRLILCNLWCWSQPVEGPSSDTTAHPTRLDLLERNDLAFPIFHVIKQHKLSAILLYYWVNVVLSDNSRHNTQPSGCVYGHMALKSHVGQSTTRQLVVYTMPGGMTITLFDHFLNYLGLKSEIVV